MRFVTLRLCALSITLGLPPTVAAQPALRQIDSTLVRETASVLLARVGYLAVGPRAHLFVTDLTEGRIIEMTSKGEILKTYGRKGKGPGELASVGPVAFFGDTLMVVMDNGQRRIVTFDLRTGKSPGGFAANLRYPSLASSGNELLATSLNPTATSTVTVMSTNGDVRANEGTVPAIARKHPMLLDPFTQSAITVRGRDVFVAYELTQSISMFTRGSKSTTEFRVPAEKRWGVNDALFEQVINDPAKTGLDVIYHHSAPLALDFVAPDILGVVTLDPVVKPNVGYTGQYYLSLIDIKQRRACVDALIPLPSDPLPHVAIVHDTLVVLQQASDVQGEPAAAIRRFAVNSKACKWVAM